MLVPAGLLLNEVIFLPLMAAVNSVLLECWLRLCQHMNAADADRLPVIQRRQRRVHPLTSSLFFVSSLLSTPPLCFCCFISLKVKPPFPLASLPAVPSSHTLISLNSKRFPLSHPR